LSTFNFRQELGILRSVAIYYLKPFVRRRLEQFYRQFVSPGDLCFDIGAHLGNRSDAWLRLGAKVVAVDPQPRCVRFLERRFGSKKGFTLLPKAIGAQPGQANFQVSELTPTISSLAGAEWQQVIQEKSSFTVSWDREVPVEVTTLDQLIATYGMPAFCKIDVEDYELEALQGLSEPIPALSLEYFAPTVHRTLACVQRLDQLGPYEYNWSYGESLRLEAPSWLPAAEMIRFLEKVSPDDRSGDIYARLKKHS
jgi:FkbM family methyltransferase